MKKIQIIIFIFVIAVLLFLFNLPKIKASSIIEESGKLYVVYSNLPDTIQVVLSRFCIDYQNNRLVGNFDVDKEKYQVFIMCNERYYSFSELITELDTAASRVQGTSYGYVRKAEIINNFARLMRKYESLLIEKAFSDESGFRISKPLTFDDDPRVPGDIVRGSIECSSGICFVGAIIDDLLYFQAGLKKGSINFINTNERRLNFLADDSSIIVYKTENDYKQDIVYKTIKPITVHQLTYYQKLKQSEDIVYSNVIKGTFMSNDVSKRNQIVELLTMTLGCVVPSIKYPEGFEIQQIAQKIDNKDYFKLENYKNFYCTEFNEEGVSIYVENFPDENEIASIEGLITDYLTKKIKTPPTFVSRTTTLRGSTENAMLIIPQTSEEAKTLLV